MKSLFLLILFSIPFISFSQTNPDELLANEYYNNGEFEKAKGLYQKLASSQKNIPNIHNNYFKLLIAIEEYKTAEKYVKKAQKYYPNNVYYQIDEGLIDIALGNPDAADKKFKSLIQDISDNQYMVRTASQYFINNQLNDYALRAYLVGRKKSNSKNLFALELANTYRIIGKKSEMLDEYLVFATLRPNNLRYVKNVLQNILQDQDDIKLFQNLLIEKVQSDPNQIIYSDLLIWVNIQQNDYISAYYQARAIVKRLGEGPSQILDIAEIAEKNKYYSEAEEIYTYVVDNFKNDKYYASAKNQLINVKEILIKEQYPIDTLAIRDLTIRYHQLINEIGLNNQTVEAFRSKALLHAFYLDEKDSAINILNQILTIPRIDRNTIARSKLNLGDIYLLQNEPWESTLLYSQVEKDFKSSQNGYEAKLRNAKLNYYKGNFELAKGHLDILKTATTKEIANDAMSLSLLIQNNTVLDTSDFVMEQFASIELLEFQHKTDEAIKAYRDMLDKYPQHSLVDDIYWKLANLSHSTGSYENALLYLDTINEGFAKGIYGDDAFFIKAQILEENLFDPDQAMDLYKKFMIQYPGSIYVSDARKRFRKLRGDIVN